MVCDEEIISILLDYGISHVVRDLMTKEVFSVPETMGIWLSMDLVKMWIADFPNGKTDNRSYTCGEFLQLLDEALEELTERKKHGFEAGNDLCETAADTPRGLTDQNGSGIQIKFISAKDHTPVPLHKIIDWFICCDRNLEDESSSQAYFLSYNVKHLCSLLAAAGKEIRQGEYRHTFRADSLTIDLILRPADGNLSEGEFSADAMIRMLEAALEKRRERFANVTEKEIEKEREACRELADFLQRRNQRYQGNGGTT